MGKARSSGWIEDLCPYLNSVPHSTLHPDSFPWNRTKWPCIWPLLMLFSLRSGFPSRSSRDVKVSGSSSYLRDLMVIALCELAEMVLFILEVLCVHPRLPCVNLLRWYQFYPRGSLRMERQAITYPRKPGYIARMGGDMRHTLFQLCILLCVREICPFRYFKGSHQMTHGMVKLCKLKGGRNENV